MSNARGLNETPRLALELIGDTARKACAGSRIGDFGEAARRRNEIRWRQSIITRNVDASVRPSHYRLFGARR